MSKKQKDISTTNGKAKAVKSTFSQDEIRAIQAKASASAAKAIEQKYTKLIGDLESKLKSLKNKFDSETSGFKILPKEDTVLYSVPRKNKELGDFEVQIIKRLHPALHKSQCKHFVLIRTEKEVVNFSELYTTSIRSQDLKTIAFNYENSNL